MLANHVGTLCASRYAGRVKSSSTPKLRRSSSEPRHAQRASKVTRSYRSSPINYALSNSNKEYLETPRGPPSTEYHRSSTRYTNTTPELLKIFSDKNEIAHREPEGLMDTVAHKFVRFLRVASDAYFKDNLVYRAMMLESVAAVPGMVGGMMHHLSSLRKVQHDNWIRTLLDEAENERIHLFCWLDILRPTASQRLLIVGVQGIFMTAFLASYIFFPKTCHRFVGYLEEEAYKTYTKLLHHIDEGKIKDRPAPQLAIDYWNMPAGATMRDMTVIIREDEHDHAVVNHAMANMITKLRNRDMVYSEISIDDSVFETVPGTKNIDHGQVKAISGKESSL